MSKEAEERLFQVLFGERGTKVQPECEEVEIRAQRVPFNILSNPGLLAVAYPEKPFSKQEIAELTKRMKNFALTSDGDWVRLWGE